MGNQQQEGQNTYETEQKKIIETESNSQVIFHPIEQTKCREVYQIISSEGQNSNAQENSQNIKQVYEYVPVTQSSGTQNYQYEKKEIIYPNQVTTTQQFYTENNSYDIPRDSARKVRYDTEYYNVNNKNINQINYSEKYKSGSVEKIPNHLTFEVYENNPQVLKNKKIVEYEEIQGGINDNLRGGIVEGTYMIGGGGINAGQYRFEGERIEIKEQTPQENIMIEEEEINKEILRRKNNAHKGKRTYELIDKYYAVTEVDPKALRKRLREEEKQYGENAYAYYSRTKAGSQQQQQQQFRSVSASKYSSGAFVSSYMASLRNKGGAIYPADNFSKYIFEQINKLRTDPRSFIGEIEDAKSNIIKDKHGRIIYKNKIRVALAEGENVFNEAIDFLNKSAPMDKLIFSPMITVAPPMNLQELKDRTDMRKKVEQMCNDGIMIKAFWRDVIKDPKISFLLMIIDDTGTKRGLRRKDILDPDMRYIGISSAEINGNFVCYMTFSPYL